MPLSPESRKLVEDIIEDSNLAAERYLATQSELHGRLVEATVNESLEILKELKLEIQDDPYVENYRLLMFVPTQIVNLLTKEEENKDD